MEEGGGGGTQLHFTGCTRQLNFVPIYYVISTSITFPDPNSLAARVETDSWAETYPLEVLCILQVLKCKSKIHNKNFKLNNQESC